MAKPTTGGFEKALNRLEEIVNKVNSGQTSLEDSLTLCEEADALVSFCEKTINKAEKRMDALLNKNSSKEELVPSTHS
ncbi:hypothetical protein CLAVI_000569 [Candidatus Clavichlamydia salmonicola]|uniref:exodeoxyribonuclease VII small subunit n=1 Tax=Candidatus Clavichlamydia salmonicola TaxID=469812 RepID=UPI0018914119|nr:exodeoxyribonuclease VII small subunit [Candidatus Clavichlamydia salmonicola]MBF5050947.1 hypothetical protein [Candidatus Clavichlamydia salmonicola]